MNNYFVLCDFKANIITYWLYLYGFLVLAGAIYLVIWMGDIMALLKKDAKAGKDALWIWALACALFFGVSPFLGEIMKFFGMNVPTVF